MLDEPGQWREQSENAQLGSRRAAQDIRALWEYLTGSDEEGEGYEEFSAKVRKKGQG